MTMKYGEGIYRITRDVRGWCVAKWSGRIGEPWHRVSNFYSYRGWAQAYARRMKLNVQNYESKFA